MAILAAALSNAGDCIHTIYSTSTDQSVARLVGGVKVLGHFHHGIQSLLHAADVLDVLGILWLHKSSKNALHGLVVVHPEVEKGLSGILDLLGSGHGLDSRLAAEWSPSLGYFRLALTSLGRLSNTRGRGAASTSVVIVDSLHVIPEVPLTGKSISRSGTLATVVDTKERLVTMAMEAVSLTLVAEEAGSRRESSTLARISLAAIGLEVRVDEFASQVRLGFGDERQT